MFLDFLGVSKVAFILSFLSAHYCLENGGLCGIVSSMFQTISEYKLKFLSFRGLIRIYLLYILQRLPSLVIVN